MNRDQILDTAGNLINGDRARDYGDAAENFQRIADLWAPVLGVDVTATDVALCLTQLKIARLITSPTHQDSWVDGAGYIALGGEIAGRSALDAALYQEPALTDAQREEMDAKVAAHNTTSAAAFSAPTNRPYVVNRVPRVGRQDHPAFDPDTIHPLRTEANTCVTDGLRRLGDPIDLTEAVYADPQGETFVRGTE